MRVNSPIEGVHDLYKLVIAMVIAPFFPIALIERHHIAITFLGSALGRKVNAWLNAVANVALLVFLVLMSWQFAKYVVEVHETGETTWVLGWPVAPWWGLATAIIILCIPVQLFVTIKDVIVPRDAPGHGHAPHSEEPS